MLKELHFMLKTGTSDSRKDWFNVGDYKQLANEVGGRNTCPPEEVKGKVKELLSDYHSKKNKSLEEIIAFHFNFEAIHPFQDGNGRVGRLIMFKECLANHIVPFIIDEEHKLFYYRGLREWRNERGYLIETCLSCQDRYKEWLAYFGIKE
jgi:Fic family protein